MPPFGSAAAHVRGGHGEPAVEPGAQVGIRVEVEVDPASAVQHQQDGPDVALPRRRGPPHVDLHLVTVVGDVRLPGTAGHRGLTPRDTVGVVEGPTLVVEVPGERGQAAAHLHGTEPDGGRDTVHGQVEHARRPEENPAIGTRCRNSSPSRTARATAKPHPVVISLARPGPVAHGHVRRRSPPSMTLARRVQLAVVVDQLHQHLVPVEEGDGGLTLGAPEHVHPARPRPVEVGTCRQPTLKVLGVVVDPHGRSTIRLVGRARIRHEGPPQAPP